MNETERQQRGRRRIRIGIVGGGICGVSVANAIVKTMLKKVKPMDRVKEEKKDATTTTAAGASEEESLDITIYESNPNSWTSTTTTTTTTTATTTNTSSAMAASKEWRLPGMPIL